MKKILFILISLIFSITISNAQECYRVQKDAAKVYIAPSKHSEILCTYGDGCLIDVYEITDNWAKIGHNDEYAYMNISNLTDFNTPNYINPIKYSDENWMSVINMDFPNLDFSLGNTEWMCYVILILSIALLVLRTTNDNRGLSDTQFTFYWITLLGVSILEITYMIGAIGNPGWFCDPDEVGWIMTVINFIIFMIIVGNQIMAFFDIMNEWRSYTNSNISFAWGYSSWVGVVIASVALSFFAEELIPYVLIIFAICQIIQIINIFKNVIKYDSALTAILFSLVYLIASAATVAITVLLISIIIVLVIIFIILGIIFGRDK